MKKFTYASVAALALTFAASQSQAVELWNQHLRGVDEGMAMGALPPQGLYFVDDSYVLTYGKNTPSNTKADVNLTALVEVPILLYSTGLKVLGADYAVAVAQPFDYTQIGIGGTQYQGHTGTFNTLVVPVILSWTLPYDLHVKPAFGVFLDDGSSEAASTRVVGAANGYTTYDSSLAFSWLHDGWNASAIFIYDTSTKNTTTNYQTGDEFSIDYSVTKTIGKWTVGIGGFQQNQLQRDSGTGVTFASGASNPTGVGTNAQAAGIGPILGYQFGGIGLQAIYNHDYIAHNDVVGDTFQLRAVVPLY